MGFVKFIVVIGSLVVIDYGRVERVCLFVNGRGSRWREMVVGGSIGCMCWWFKDGFVGGEFYVLSLLIWGLI